MARQPIQAPEIFRDRHDAGRRLAAALLPLASEDPVVLALPRGGVPVAVPVAGALAAPLDVVVVRKVGVPWQRELAMGAVGEAGVLVVNGGVVRLLGISRDILGRAAAIAADEVAVRLERYRTREPASVEGRTVIVVDDGVATGATARAAGEILRRRGARRTVLAVPVGTPDTVASLRAAFDTVVCLEQPDDLVAIGHWYDDFPQVSEDDVQRMLAEPRIHGAGPPLARAVRIPADRVRLRGDLVLPDGARGLVLFAHGGGSGRRSPWNREVAAKLQSRGFGTLLFDLLTRGEETDPENAFDVPLLTQRLLAATRWALERPELRDLHIGYFGTSTGAVAAIAAAAEAPGAVEAVVSRGGRPDLAAAHLGDVRAPVSLIVGGEDHEVLRLNREAQRALGGRAELAVVSGASHLFEEEGALDAVGSLAAEFLRARLGAGARTDAGGFLRPLGSGAP